MKEEQKKLEEEEGLTILPQEKEEKEEDNPKMNVFLPVLALTVVGVGTFWYYRESKDQKENSVPKKPDSRPKIMSRSERL